MAQTILDLRLASFRPVSLSYTDPISTQPRAYKLLQVTRESKTAPGSMVCGFFSLSHFTSSPSTQHRPNLAVSCFTACPPTAKPRNAWLWRPMRGVVRRPSPLNGTAWASLGYSHYGRHRTFYSHVCFELTFLDYSSLQTQAMD